MAWARVSGCLIGIVLAAGSSTGSGPDTVAAQATSPRLAIASPIGDVDAFLDTCPSAGELAILERDFPIFTQGQSPISDERPYKCQEPVSGMAKQDLSDRLIVYQALRLIRHMQLEVPLRWTSLHPYNWLKSKIDGISLRDGITTPFCCYHPVEDPSRLTVVLPTRSRDVLRSLTEFIDPQSGIGAADTAILLFHETRHVDKPHNCTTCQAGDGCDTNLKYLGAWAVQYFMARRMGLGSIDVGLDGSTRKAYDRSQLLDRADTVLARRFCDAVEPPPPVGPPPPPGPAWLRTPEQPGFEFQLRITPQGGASVIASKVPDCIAETLCAAGALPDRPEVFVKLIGPRPNGFLWVQISRFTPSKVEVWVRQIATKKTKYYKLGAVGSASQDVSGLQDREAFTP